MHAIICIKKTNIDLISMTNMFHRLSGKVSCHSVTLTIMVENVLMSCYRYLNRNVFIMVSYHELFEWVETQYLQPEVYSLFC